MKKQFKNLLLGIVLTTQLSGGCQAQSFDLDQVDDSSLIDDDTALAKEWFITNLKSHIKKYDYVPELAVNTAAVSLVAAYIYGIYRINKRSVDLSQAPLPQQDDVAYDAFLNSTFFQNAKTDVVTVNKSAANTATLNFPTEKANQADLHRGSVHQSARPAVKQDARQEPYITLLKSYKALALSGDNSGGQAPVEELSLNELRKRRLEALGLAAQGKAKKAKASQKPASQKQASKQNLDWLNPSEVQKEFARTLFDNYRGLVGDAENILALKQKASSAFSKQDQDARSAAMAKNSTGLTIALWCAPIVFGASRTVGAKIASLFPFLKRNKIIEIVKAAKQSKKMKPEEIRLLHAWFKNFIEDCINADIIKYITLFGPSFTKDFSRLALAVLEPDKAHKFYARLPKAVLLQSEASALAGDPVRYGNTLLKLSDELIKMSIKN